jgi:hypothetical protein
MSGQSLAVVEGVSTPAAFLSVYFGSKESPPLSCANFWMVISKHFKFVPVLKMGAGYK